MTRKTTATGLMGQMLELQKAQIKLAREMLDHGEAVTAWQKKSVDGARQMMKLQSDWLRLWGW